MDEMELLALLGRVEGLPPEALERAELALGWALQEQSGFAPSSAPSTTLLRSRTTRRRPAFLATGIAGLTLAAGSYLALNTATTASHSSSRPPFPHAHRGVAIDAEAAAYVGKAPVLAVKTLPQGYKKATATVSEGPSAGLAPGVTEYDQTFTGPAGPVSVDEVVGPQRDPLLQVAQGSPGASRTITVGGRTAFMLNMQTLALAASGPRAVGYVLVWPAQATSWVEVSGGSRSVLEQFAGVVVPVRPDPTK